MWSLRYSDAALKQLRKIDPAQRNIVLSWMSKHVDCCEDPRTNGKSLVGDLSEKWRYRIGNYRVLCEINDETLTVLAIKVGHRKEIYRR
jgi:mRNA interferase RelE/StbE